MGIIDLDRLLRRKRQAWSSGALLVVGRTNLEASGALLHVVTPNARETHPAGSRTSVVGGRGGSRENGTVRGVYQLAIAAASSSISLALIVMPVPVGPSLSNVTT
jgi:hypothetical protein